MKKVLGIVVLVVGLFLAVGSGVMAAEPPDLEVDIGITGNDVEVNVDVDADTSTINVDGGDNSDYNINGTNLQSLIPPVNTGAGVWTQYVCDNLQYLLKFAEQSGMQLVLVSDALAYKIQSDEATFVETSEDLENFNYRLVSLEGTIQGLTYATETEELEVRLLALEDKYKDLLVENVQLQSHVAYMDYLDSQQVAVVAVEAIAPTLPDEQGNSSNKLAVGLGIGVPSLALIIIGTKTALKSRSKRA